MDILASRLAKDASGKSKSAKKVKKLGKNDVGKSKTRSVPKVDSSKVGKISKKQKAKNVVTDIPSKKKQAIKNIIVKSQNDENEKLIQKVTNVKNKKSKVDVKQKVKDIQKSLKDVIAKREKVGKKDTEVLKNKINLQSDVKPSSNISSKKVPQTIKTKKSKDVQAELVKTKKVKQTEPEVTKSKKVKIETQIAKSIKGQSIEPEIVKRKKNKKIKPETVKDRKVIVKDSKIETSEPKVSKNNLKSDKKTKLNKKELKAKALKENNVNIVKPIKTKNEEKADDLDQTKKLKLSKKLKSKKVKLIKVENNEEIKSIKSKKRKQEDVEEEDLQSSAQPTLTKKEVLPFVKALLKVAANDTKSKNSLFNSEKPPILLSIACIKVPKVALHQMRIPLPNCMVTEDDEIALFVKDLKKGRRRDYEDTVHHYEDLLQKHGCTRVKTILPINQVKTEYRQFEMRRRLLNSYDYFLVDGRISGHMAHLLGKTFRQKRKLPTSIHMDKKDLKEEIDNALKKTSLEIHSTGDSSITQVATCSMSADKIAENIMAVVKHLSEHFPGGWGNIRSLSIKTPLGLAIPIYITLKSRNTVEVPVVKPKRPKAYIDVEGELSTFTKNVSVKVAADGTIDVQHLGGNESDSDDEGDEDETEEISEKTEGKIKKDTKGKIKKDIKGTIKKEKTKGKDDDAEKENEDDDDDDEVEDEDEESDDE